MTYKVSLPKNWPIIAVLLAIILTMLIGGYRYIARDTNPIPENLRQQLTFSPFVVPLSSKDYTTSNYKFSTAENSVQILSYTVHSKNGDKLAISEYSQPPQFSEIAEYKDRFLTNVAQQYDTVQTSNGAIYLGRLAKQNDKQIGVMLERGLIVFLSPNKELNQAQWRNLGDQLEIQKS